MGITTLRVQFPLFIIRRVFARKIRRRIQSFYANSAGTFGVFDIDMARLIGGQTQRSRRAMKVS